MSAVDLRREWLETDGLGGFASGTAAGIRTRRYHAALVAAARPPTGRRLLLAGCDVHLEREGRSEALSAQAYLPDAVHPDGLGRLVAFRADPWPTWRYRLDDGAELEHELFLVRGRPLAVLLWRWLGHPRAGTLRVRPFVSGRDYHALERARGELPGEPERRGERLRFALRPDAPELWLAAGGAWRHDPHWYRDFRYDEERARGFDFTEDLLAPGELSFDLAAGPAALLVAAGSEGESLPERGAREAALALRSAEWTRRSRAGSPLERAADAYRARRGAGETLVAGYPWFTDWGRDTFIALRGLCLATGRLRAARDVLVEWAGSVSEGMLPNRFPDEGDAPEFNAVDASLWFVVAAHELIGLAEGRGVLSAADRERLRDACQAILWGYARGTRHGIGLDDDGLLAAGEPGVQLTWMDARIGERVVTPRIGKPVEVQALWWSALRLAAPDEPRWAAVAERCEKSFAARFWNAERGCLYDVVDADHAPGALDATLRPNQIFAVGGLPHALLSGERARQVVDTVERELWTPLGLRSLARGEPGYVPRYAGGPAERDAAYHQGTAWPWLLGPFVEAWLRVRGASAPARSEARRRFLAPLHAHLAEAGIGHVSEVADAEAPHAPGGCPFQAWSLGELLRLERSVLAPARSDP